MKLLNAIEKEALKNNRIISCLLQVKIAREETKFGLSADELQQILESDDFKKLKNIKILGLMGMATYTNDTSLVRDEFRKLVSIFNSIRKSYFLDIPYFKELSMGMSADYKIAVKEGSTMIRIGSLIFGERI
jgi:pyridoxal phosphate enzyme (YggS family)